METKGAAYAFFNCRASTTKITERLPKLRGMAKVPPLLELALIEGPKNFKTEDAELKWLLEEAAKAGRKYVLEGKLPAVVNEETAELLVRMVMVMYNMPSLFAKNEPMQADVFYFQAGAWERKE